MIPLAVRTSAEPVLDHVLSGTHLATAGHCAILKIDFNVRIRYVSHFPLKQGDELRIAFRPIDPLQYAAVSQVRREAVRVPNGSAAAIQAIDFEASVANGPTVRIQFASPVYFQVAQGRDFESIIVSISTNDKVANCTPIFPPPELEPGQNNKHEVSVRARLHPTRKLSDANMRAIAAAMDEGRAALRKRRYKKAEKRFTKVLNYPENKYSAEAQEFLGVAKQKAGQLAGARAEYEDYLRRYRTGEGHDRVRQRLAGILTALGEPHKALPMSKRKLRNGRPGEQTWSLFGSASVFYIRDDSYRTLRDPTLPPIPNEDADAHRVHQNILLSSLDLFGTWSNDLMKSKFRFSGAEETNFIDRHKDITNVAAFYAETSLTQLDLLGRVGRQTRNSGGVIGRFDGGFLSWRANSMFSFNLVGGSPVYLRRDEPFKDGKYFYGTSVDIRPFFDGLDVSLFAIEYRDRSLLDRRAVGAEFRYFNRDKFAFGTIDYDIHYNQLNAAIFSGSWTLTDKSTIYGSADYRKTPYLSAWNALQGQPFLTLYDMLKFYTKEEIDKLAIDRTATYKSAMIGFSHPITEKFQVSGDVTAVNMSGMPASGGISATRSTGTQYYLSSQLIGTGLFKAGDMYIAGARYADLSSSKLYALDFSARYPIIADLRVNPRLRLGYQKGSTIDLEEYTVLPSILLNYSWTHDLSFELEVGTRWSLRREATTTERTTELFLTVGLRNDFYIDSTKPPFSKSKPGLPAAPATHN